MSDIENQERDTMSMESALPRDQLVQAQMATLISHSKITTRMETFTQRVRALAQHKDHYHEKKPLSTSMGLRTPEEKKLRDKHAMVIPKLTVLEILKSIRFVKFNKEARTHLTDLVRMFGNIHTLELTEEPLNKSVLQTIITSMESLVNYMNASHIEIGRAHV